MLGRALQEPCLSMRQTVRRGKTGDVSLPDRLIAVVAKARLLRERKGTKTGYGFGSHWVT
jgi:hypothetical protein